MSWEKVTLGSISENIQTGPFGSQLHQSDYSENGIPVVMPKDMVGGHISEASIARVSESHVNRLNRHVINVGDILYSRRGDVGRCALATEKEQGWLCGTGCLKVTIDKKKANAKFVFYQLQKSETVGWVEKHAVGATMLNLNTSILSDVPIEVPELEKQDKIVGILSAYDDLIENSQKQIKLLEEVAQRLYKEWFIDLRFPGHETTPIINGIPEGWIKVTIAAVCQTLGGGTPSTKVPAYYENGSILWVTPTDITKSNSLAILDTEKKITKEGLANSSAKMVPPGTILMTSRASIGFFGLFENEVCTNQGFINCIPNKTELQMFLLYNLKSRVDEIRQKASGSTFLEISKSAFREFQIIIPDDRTLQRFQDITYGLYKKVRTHTKQIYELTQVRNRLLPKLMNAEIEVHICKHNLAFHNSLCFQA